ncbi:NACHT domain-containing protein [Leptolyngbya sp. NIES-2104]|uniref:NACHT domain-containing protein n=1 Tax=Leptolyngbya sp. NIES-2104 TaxID=1552121 RepID=UPI0006ECA99A|nr:NACHT domain-containing protein [Leptolyngbya sp. NIES-2104]GAP94664.1 HEAT repeat [Leptolyngbya sp. NIES-2104]
MVFDPGLIVTTEVLKKLTTLVLDTAWKQGGHAIDKQKQQKIESAVREYVQTYEKRHCSLKYDCLRMDNSLTLEEIYTDVQVLNTRESRRFESPEALKELFLGTGRGFAFEKTTREEGIAVANLEPRLMVLGSPGIGKSTFLRKVGLEALKWQTARYRHELIPVFIELRQFGDRHSEIESLIADEFETCGFPDPEGTTRKLLLAGKLLILLDGLDEVPTAYCDRAIEQIDRFVDRYDKNRFIASCRIAAYKGGFPRFKDVTMANFDDEQMETFVRQWFRREPKIADQYWELLKSSDYKAVKELGQTPLLLTLLCAVYDESQSLPKQRAALYGEALEVWLKKWAAERRVHRDPIYQELNLQLEQVLLSEIAYQSFAEDQLFFSKRELTEQIRAFLVNNLNAPKHLDAQATLYAIQVQQGILVERARDTFSFSHLTFQEYLTAQYIVDEQQLEALVTNHLTDFRWREVFLLVAGLLRNADKLLELMERKTQEIISSSINVCGLVIWSNLITANTESACSPITKRALAIFLALSFDKTLQQSRALKLVSTLDKSQRLEQICELTNNLARKFIEYRSLSPVSNTDNSIENIHEIAHVLFGKLEEIKIFETKFSSSHFFQQQPLQETRITGSAEERPFKSLKEFEEDANFVLDNWCIQLRLPPEWADLAQYDVYPLRDYLYANELMIRCKEAALRVSPQVWNAIESRMLTISDNETI